MTDEETNKLEQLLELFPGQVHFFDQYDGIYLPISAIRHNHRDTDDPQEPPESIALIMNSSKHIGLLGVEATQFVILNVMHINWG